MLYNHITKTLEIFKTMENDTTTVVAERILQQYLSRYAPAENTDTNIILRTSQDIVEELSEVMELTINEVANLLASQGYKIVHSKDGRIGWAMKLKTPR